MADEETPEAAAPEEGGGNKKLIIIIAAAVVLLLAGGGAAFFALSGGGDAPPPEETAAEGVAGGEEAASEAGTGGATKEGGQEAAPAAEAAATPEAAPEEDEESEDLTVTFGATHTFKPFNLNLGNPLENHFVRMEIAIEYRNGEDQKKELEARRAQLRDAVIAVTSRKTREFLLGPDGKDQLRLEILNKINQYLDKKVDSIFITDMLIE